ncbi:hypothetical protein PIB30_056753 [Stylosanthes scabra]|uniref:Uncharacterized protein n=1 Tax=Stylosanthes scabra TaxID=79078 RepID=A0ABU6RJN7_9FABA|nr:hypothetical protein [Stylosanthes scabra]
MQLREEVRVMKTKSGCGNGVKNIRIGLDRLESDWKWPRNAKGARMKRCERELLSSDWSKLGLFGKSNSHSGGSLTVQGSPRQHGISAWEPGDSRSDPIRGSIFRLRARGPGDSRIVPVTAAYSWESGAESRTPSNICSKCESNPKLWVRCHTAKQNDPSLILGILVAPCDTSFKTFQTSFARDKGLSELQRTKVPAPSERVTPQVGAWAFNHPHTRTTPSHPYTSSPQHKHTQLTA